jgi:hypothetical protein
VVGSFAVAAWEGVLDRDKAVRVLGGHDDFDREQPESVGQPALETV